MLFGRVVIIIDVAVLVVANVVVVSMFVIVFITKEKLLTTVYDGLLLAYVFQVHFFVFCCQPESMVMDQ